MNSVALPEPLNPADEVAARLASIVDSSDDVIVSKTLDGTITSWNPAAERVLGYTAEEAIGQSINLIIPRERQAEEVEMMKEIHAGRRVDHFETVRVAKDGRTVHVSLTISRLWDYRRQHSVGPMLHPARVTDLVAFALAPPVLAAFTSASARWA
jgi:PAS domain S-box-containing protein